MKALNNNIGSLPILITMAIFVFAACSCSTANKIQEGKTNSTKLYDSILTDKDGNRYAVKLFQRNTLWMTANLMLNITDSYCYNNTDDNCKRYGRLYTWVSAQKGCSLLGYGWRLPSKEEWQQLAAFYGRNGKDSIEIRKNAFRKLLDINNSQFKAVLGGGRKPDGTYARLEAHGFYWTATEQNDSTAWFANFAKGSQSLYHQPDGEKPWAFSVRCVKNLDGK